MDLLGVLRPSLLRAFLLRTLAAAVIPLAVFGLVVAYVTDQVILQRFQEASEVAGQQAAKDIDEFVRQTTRYARLISEIQQTDIVLASRDPQVIRAYLLPLRSRLGLEIVNLAAPDGEIIAGAQDPRLGGRISGDLLTRAQAKAEQAWVIRTDRNGVVTMRAVAAVRQRGEVTGLVEVAQHLDAAFLAGVQREDRGPLATQFALIWDGSVRASTVTAEMTGFPTAQDVDDTDGDQIVGRATLGRNTYHAIYTLVETRQPTLGILAVLVSLEPVESAQRIILLAIVALMAVLTVAIVIFAYGSAEGITRPLRDLVQAAQRVQSGDLSARIDRRAPHEIGALQAAFDAMAHTLEQRAQSNRRLLAELQVQALNDSLTGLPNRILFHDRLQQQILFSQRQGGRFALFVMDLDRFKEVNDTFGHQSGDRLLVMVGERVRGVLRDSDTVARFGGDEFALLIPTADTEERATAVARKIQAAFEAPFTLDHLILNVEASIGISIFPEHGEDPSALVKRADAAMYMAKRNKSGYALYAPSDDQESRDGLLLMGEFRGAIEHDELVLHFQPEVELRSGEIVAVEALVRWRHPSRGLLSPDLFIPFAEQTGLMRPLTRWVIDSAIRQVRTWRTRSGAPMQLAVNLSARDFQDPELPGHVEAALIRRGMTPAQLKLEITESVVMADAARSLETLTALRTMGVRLSIDDFGPGYSSLAYLKRLPVDEIKIDRSFVIDLVADADTSAIVRGTIDLAHDLERTVVAEGVEDEPTAALLSAYGCDAAQGYYYTRPLAAEEMADLISKSPPWVTRGRLADPAGAGGPSRHVAALSTR